MEAAGIEAPPARQQTHFTLEQAREAKLALYDIAGRRVVTVKPGVFLRAGRDRTPTVWEAHRGRDTVV